MKQDYEHDIPIAMNINRSLATRDRKKKPIKIVLQFLKSFKIVACKVKTTLKWKIISTILLIHNYKMKQKNSIIETQVYRGLLTYFEKQNVNRGFDEKYNEKL
jgi:hypothetical protein